jgi:hypothetical protein
MVFRLGGLAVMNVADVQADAKPVDLTSSSSLASSDIVFVLASFIAASISHIPLSRCYCGTIEYLSLVSGVLLHVPGVPLRSYLNNSFCFYPIVKAFEEITQLLLAAKQSRGNIR